MNYDNLPSKLLDQSSTQKTLNFEYSLLEAETRRVVQQCTNEIKTLIRRNTEDIINIGQKLIEVKQHLGHGNFRNWLKFEFSWSISAATKFMQVAEQFKYVNFTHLNITASTLYLIGAPSTPKEARVEILERASNGESIGYAKARIIVYEHRKTKKKAVKSKTTSIKGDEVVNSTETKRYETSAVSAQEVLTQKNAISEERQSLSSPESLLSFAFKCKQIAIITKDISNHTIQTLNNTENQVAISDKKLDAVIAEMIIIIKNLTPEQLAMVIIKAAYNELSEYHLSAIMNASQQALNTLQQFGK